MKPSQHRRCSFRLQTKRLRLPLLNSLLRAAGTPAAISISACLPPHLARHSSRRVVELGLNLVVRSAGEIPELHQNFLRERLLQHARMHTHAQVHTHTQKHIHTLHTFMHTHAQAHKHTNTQTHTLIRRGIEARAACTGALIRGTICTGLKHFQPPLLGVYLLYLFKSLAQSLGCSSHWS